MTMSDIIRALGFDDAERTLHGKKYNCTISIYRCDLKKKQNFDLFNFRTTICPDEVFIELPEGTIDDIYNYATMYCTENLIYLLSFIKTNAKEKLSEYKDSIIYVAFSVLHEFGHWIYFDELEYSTIDYINEDSKYRSAVMKLDSNIKKDEYRKIPSEYEADRFAFAHLTELLHKLSLNEE